MNEGKQNPTAPNSPNTAKTEPVAYGYCSWHRGYSIDIRIISVDEQGSGPGGAQSACGPCRDQHDLIPFSDRP
ncbi:hypothetical protein [Streptomyces ortus]|uniref:Uncharacterized protein n=1 Tax=Streptomyces ortus TaxID=2867268 RepID=A0ABT3V6L8_9ACTN|nr:hypothetical protein [Streptomyces ortus]MCX4235523.1 hypothetical protein [Streptomyces ortus]